MSVTKPGQGSVTVVSTSSGGLPPNAAGAVPTSSTKSGAWRADIPFETNEALKVTMRNERGITPKGLLSVPFRFQCPPLDRFGRPWRWDWQTRDTLRAGQQLGRGAKQLDVVSFATMFVDLDEGQEWVTWRGSFNVQRLLDEMREIGDALAGFRLTIGQPGLWGPRPLVNMVAVFTSLSPEQRGGALGTEYADVEFTEYPRQRLQRSSARRPSERSQKRTHRLQHGDTLYSIARHFFHAASEWRSIRDANGIKNVSPDSADALAAWAKAHHKTTLTIPATMAEVVGGFGNTGAAG